MLRKALPHFKQAHYNRLMDLLNFLALGSPSLYTRDGAIRLIWYPCINQPRLLLLGLRSLLRRGRLLHRESFQGHYRIVALSFPMSV